MKPLPISFAYVDYGLDSGFDKIIFAKNNCSEYEITIHTIINDLIDVQINRYQQETLFVFGPNAEPKYRCILAMAKYRAVRHRIAHRNMLFRMFNFRPFSVPCLHIV